MTLIIFSTKLPQSAHWGGIWRRQNIGLKPPLPKILWKNEHAFLSETFHFLSDWFDLATIQWVLNSNLPAPSTVELFIRINQYTHLSRLKHNQILWLMAVAGKYVFSMLWETIYGRCGGSFVLTVFSFECAFSYSVVNWLGRTSDRPGVPERM